jgi:hypothetical protein
MLQKILPLCIWILSYIAPRQMGQWAAGLLQRPRKYAIQPEQLPAFDNIIVLNEATYMRWGSRKRIAMLIHGVCSSVTIAVIRCFRVIETSEQESASH